MDSAEVSPRRGDVVLVVAPGDYGKPRPAVIVQSDIFNDIHVSVTVCPVTSTLVEAPLFRILLRPSKTNGLVANSQVMVDKIQALRRDRIRERVGAVAPATLREVDAALRLWLRL